VLRDGYGTCTSIGSDIVAPSVDDIPGLPETPQPETP
jgi:hypothetical protein